MQSSSKASWRGSTGIGWLLRNESDHASLQNVVRPNITVTNDQVTDLGATPLNQLAAKRSAER